MTKAVMELYNALVEAGVKVETAERAAQSVIAIEDKEALASKGDVHEAFLDLRREMSEMKVDIIKWNVGTMIAMTTIFSTIIAIMKFWK